MRCLNQSVGVIQSVIVLLAAAFPAFAQQQSADRTIELGAPFNDHAVLQREMPVPVWGWSEPGAKVTVNFAGQTQSATAGKDGKWMVKLDPLEASAQPQTMQIKDHHGNAVTLADILVGEVWLASGQSNMQWLASKSDVGRVLQAQIAERVEAGQESPPIIREAKVTDVYSALHPIEHADAQWTEDRAQMSAIAYAFAYELYKELGVPIGILNCSFSSTSIEAWVPREGFEQGEDDYTRSIRQQILESDPSSPEHKAAWSAYYTALHQAIKDNEKRAAAGEEALPIDVPLPGNVSNNRGPSWLYNARMNPMVPYAIRGAIWNQGYANMGGGLTYYNNLHSLTHGWRSKWNRPDLPIYFHQFYTPGNGEGENHPSFDSTAEMRLGTWLARDIPHTAMASQIDIGGSVHYYRKALAGQRLALHALKNQYDKDIAADGPMFKSYTVQGNKLIVDFDHAEGGLVVGQVDTDSKNEGKVLVIPDGAPKVSLFYLADENHVWHRAHLTIDGSRAVLTAPGVDDPRGVSYGTGGVAFQPNVYNRAMLPLTPFTYYDHKLVTSAAWPHDPPKIAGYEPDPDAGGLRYDYRKFPILSTQFRDNAVLQHGKPVKIWGAARRMYFPEAPGRRVIHFSFNGIEKSIELTPDMNEWAMTVPAMKPSAEPKTLKVRLEINGEVAHERTVENIVIGDVWFVAAPKAVSDLPAVDPAQGIVRVIQREAKRDGSPKPSRFSVAVSTTPKNRFASYWMDADVATLPGSIAHRIGAKAGGIPVGVIFMQSSPGKSEADAPLKGWLPFHALPKAPSLSDDYAKLGTQYPGSPTYNTNVLRYIDAWQTYWNDYIPEMIATKAVPDGAAWGVIPKTAPADAKSPATQQYNVMVHSFTPAALKGVIFIYAQQMLAQVNAADFDEQMQVLTASWAQRFGNGVIIEKLKHIEDAQPFANSLEALVQRLYQDGAAKQ